MEALNFALIALLLCLWPSARRIFFTSSRQSESSCGSNYQKSECSARVIFFDILKGVAIIAVLCGHTLELFSPQAASTYLAAGLEFVVNHLRFAIPFFLIASGALIKPSSCNNLKSFFASKIKRIFLPYALCVAVICLYHDFNLKTFVELSLSGQAAVPYYFVLVLFQLYLLYPLLLKFSVKPYFLSASFIISVLCYLILPWKIGGVFFCGSFLYFFCYGIERRSQLLEVSRKVPLPKSLLLVLIAYSLGCLLFPGKYYNQSYWYGVALFIVFQSIWQPFLKDQSLPSLILRRFGQESLWIFLSHYPLVQLICAHLRPQPWSLALVVTLAASLLGSYLLAVLCRTVYAYAISGLSRVFQHAHSCNIFRRLGFHSTTLPSKSQRA